PIFLYTLPSLYSILSSFFFHDTAPTEIYTLSLHDALPISFNFHMRIPPVLVVDKSVYVPVGDVHAAKKSDVPIDDHNLAVVAKVNAVGKQHEVDAEEWIDLHTVFTELVDKISP